MRLTVPRGNLPAWIVAFVAGSSKYAFSGDHIISFGGMPLIAQTTIHLPSGPQSLWMGSGHSDLLATIAFSPK
jgi:hypothetical protein